MIKRPGLRTAGQEIPANVNNRPPDWQTLYLQARESQVEAVPWYPEVTGQPGANITARQKVFSVDEAGMSVGIQPQEWDTWAVNVIAGANPVEGWAAKPGQDTVMIINTGANPVIISPNREKAVIGVGISLGAADMFTISTQGAGWFASPLGTTVQVSITFFEAPTTHLPPKPQKG